MPGRLSGRLPAALLAVLLLAGGMNVSKGESQMEIPITDIRPVRIGQAENTEAGTGCTVLICENGMAAGLDVRGGGPASRESQLLNPLMAAQTVHAVVLSGGSAYGLGTANGVMQYLEEKATRRFVLMPPWDMRRPGMPLKTRTTGTAITALAAGQRSGRSPEWKPA